MTITEQQSICYLTCYIKYLYAIFSLQNFNVLFLNKKRHTFGIKSSPLCSCNLYNELSFHIFYECDHIKCLWSDIIQCIQSSVTLSTLTPQTFIFEILDSASYDFIFKNNKVFINLILQIFKLYVYKSREKKFINKNNFKAGTWKLKWIEKEIVLTNSKNTIKRNGT